MPVVHSDEIRHDVKGLYDPDATFVKLRPARAFIAFSVLCLFLSPTMTEPQNAAFTAFIARQRYLLAQERNAEIERSSLLLSNCGPKLLEQKGLSLAGLGVVSMNVGLGGKT